jgi:uncharacterized membrane protein YhaH (DUF805 family)
MVGFGEAIKRAFAGWSTWEGRATRSEYWWWFLFVQLVTLIPYVGIAATADWTTTGDGTIEGTGGSVLWWIIFIVIWLAFVLPWIAVSVRRLHDTNRSGWWFWIGLVPCIGGFWYLILMLLPSTPGQNQYG